MSNVNLIKREPINIVLGDGQEHSLKMTLNALAELEDKFGTVDLAFEELSKGSIKAIRFVLWAALLHEETDDRPALTEKKVGNLIETVDLPEIMGALTKAVESDVPIDTPAEADYKEVSKEASSPNE